MPSTKIEPSVRTAFTKDGAVVMHIRTGLMYSSNPVAGRMLELIEAGKADVEISKTIAAECGVAVEIVDNDLKEFIGLLEGYGIAQREAAL